MFIIGSSFNEKSRWQYCQYSSSSLSSLCILPRLDRDTAWNDFKDAVALALEEPQTRNLLDQGFIERVTNVDDDNLILILDDWNELSSLSPETQQLLQSSIASRRTCIFGHTSRSEDYPGVNNSTHFINADLTDAEWAFWRNQGNYTLPHACVRKDDEFDSATGKILLF
jgi:hypothetical protein